MTTIHRETTIGPNITHLHLHFNMYMTAITPLYTSSPGWIFSGSLYTVTSHPDLKILELSIPLHLLRVYLPTNFSLGLENHNVLEHCNHNHSDHNSWDYNYRQTHYSFYLPSMPQLACAMRSPLLSSPLSKFKSQSISSSRGSRKRQGEIAWVDINFNNLNPDIVQKLSVQSPYGYFQLDAARKKMFVEMCGDVWLPQ